MMDVLKSFKSLVKVEEIRTDNNVFRLHYKLTVIMLIVFSVLLTSKQYFGDPIKCITKDMAEILQAYCWSYGTFILRDTLLAAEMPGLGAIPTTVIQGAKADEQIIWQKYYQWVSIVFCLQALLFYVPRYLWKTWEGGRLRLLVSDLNAPLVSDSWSLTTKAQMIQYLTGGKYVHHLYAIRYILCEVLNLANVILQFFITDWLLGGQFFLYGYRVIVPAEINLFTQVFPKVTKCLFHTVGPSREVQRHDSLCVLSLNVLNEKLFVMLWFWLVFLAAVSGLCLIYRMCVILMPKLRTYLLRAQARLVGRKQAQLIIDKLSYGDFFILYHIGKNVNPIIFQELVLSIADALKTKRPNGAFPNGDVNTI